MCNENDHNFKMEEKDSDIFDYGKPTARWRHYLILFCTKCGKFKKVWEDEIEEIN